VRASAAQNAPVNTICSQCGSVLASGEHACSFCDSENAQALPEDNSSRSANRMPKVRVHHQWRGELNQRLQAYRARRSKGSYSEAQTALPFDEHEFVPAGELAVDVDEFPEPAQAPPRPDDFAFSIAIGRIAKTPEQADPRVMIDVSVPPREETIQGSAEPAEPEKNGLAAPATLDERRYALMVDAVCLGFAYGGFLALFGSLGGHFVFSKLSATVCFFTFAFVYLQYFGLFTIFGGSTPGMMVAGLRVASSTSDVPTPRQYMLRAVGYLLSAGTFFLGFLWILWDEEGLTWHDRLSNTYLAQIESVGVSQSTAAS
jgi:uncharacterized RDD family membrane protein YckC